MRKLRQIIMLIWIMAFVSGCSNLPDDYKNESQTSDAGMLPTLAEECIYSIPSDFYCVDFVSIENTVFLVGSGSGGPAFFCVDMESDTMKEISLPVAGSVFDLSVSEENLCLATVCYAQPDDSGISKEHFTLFELDKDASIKTHVELKGINDINLLAIGTPVVNGCAKIDSFILIIVNNRVVLLDGNGDLLDLIVWKSGHPKIAGTFGRYVCVYDFVDNEPAASLLEISPDNIIIPAELDLPVPINGLIPGNSGNSIFTVKDHTVYSLDLSTLDQSPVFSFPYGWSQDKDYYNGVSRLLECYHGRLSVYTVTQP